MKNTCLFCSKLIPIPKNRVPKKFCDKKCSISYRYIGKSSFLSSCLHCNKIFLSINSSRHKLICCNSSCAAKYRNSIKLKKGKYINCSECKKKLYKFPSEIKELNYCSKKCLCIFV